MAPKRHNVKTAIFRCSKCLYVRVELLPPEALSVATVPECPAILEEFTDPCSAHLRYVPPELHREFLRDLLKGVSGDSDPKRNTEETSEDASTGTVGDQA